MRINVASAKRSLCKRSLSDFVRTFWPIVAPSEELKWNWHMDVMCDSTQEVYERIFAGLPKEHDLVTNVPPGTSKSTIKSVMAPAWAWTRMPHFAFLGASYGSDLAEELARKNRDVVKSALYRGLFPEVQIRPDQDTKAKFMTMAGGLRCACGSQGSATGFHFNVVTIDDPLDPKRAASVAELKHINDWITSTLLQRKKDHEASVLDLVMQRLHQDDPSANLAKNKKVKHFIIPASLEFPVQPVELKKYYVDGLMDPVRLPKSVLDEKRQPNALGEYGFAGQYGQRPVPAGGGMFKIHQLRWGPVPDRFKRVVRFWDNAATKTKRSAYSCGVKMAEDADGGIWVLDVIRGQWDTGTRERIKVRTAQQDGKHVIVGLEEEPGSAGMHSSLVSTKSLKGFQVKIYKARGSKEIRAEAFSSQVNVGNVWLPQRMRQGDSWAGWAKDFVDELEFWPMSVFMDQGDACLIGSTLIETSKGSVPIERIRRGDLVLTRGGYMPVNWSGQTGGVYELVQVDFANGSSLVGTAQHPVLTQARGFVRLDSVRPDDVCLVSSSKERSRACQSREGVSTKLLSSMECNINESYQTEDIFGMSVDGITSNYIEQYGGTFTVTSPVAMKFITKTKTHSTTIQTIWNVSANQTTERSTSRAGRLRRCWNTSSESALSQWRGIDQKRAEQFTQRSVDKVGIIENPEFISANSAGRIRRLVTQGFPCTVPTYAMVVGGHATEESQRSVNTARRNSWRQERSTLSVPSPVPSISTQGVAVYNLEVEGLPEFFANGILVHNSGGAFGMLVKGLTRVGPLKRKVAVHTVLSGHDF
jgi:predicted phage terminase large subunit-like protein